MDTSAEDCPLSITIHTPTVVMFVFAQEQEGGATGAYQGSLMSQQKVKSYTQLLTSGLMRQEVADRTVAAPAGGAGASVVVGG